MKENKIVVSEFSFYFIRKRFHLIATFMMMFLWKWNECGWTNESNIGMEPSPPPPACMTFAHHYRKRANIRACFSMTAFFIFKKKCKHFALVFASEHTICDSLAETWLRWLFFWIGVNVGLFGVEGLGLIALRSRVFKFKIQN